MLINFWRNLSFRDKLIILMTALLTLSSLSLFIISHNAQKRFLKELTESIDDLSKAIQVSVQKLTSENEIDQEKLKELITKFKKRGINEISILSDTQEIIASSDPKKVGQKIAKNVKDSDFLIKAELGTRSSSDKIKEINIPIIIGDENYGYINIVMHLENLSDLQRKNFILRLFSTIIIFIFGTIVIIYMAKSYSAPIKKVVSATTRIAKDDFVMLDYDHNDSPEIRELILNFNNMVAKLQEKKELESKIRNMENRYKAAQLSSAIAHEIKNPLNFMNLAVSEIIDELEKERQINQEVIKNLLLGVKDEIAKLNNLVSNFLEYGKPLKLKFELIDIISVALDVINLTKSKLDDLNIKIHLINTEQKMFILGDREKLSSCFLNLILNSIDSIKENGNIYIKIEKQNNNIVIRFRDDGEGIDESIRDKIFEPYFSSKPNGMGLGLSFTKKIIYDHNGDIVLNDNYKEGAEFIITFQEGSLNV